MLAQASIQSMQGADGTLFYWTPGQTRHGQERAYVGICC